MEPTDRDSPDDAVRERIRALMARARVANVNQLADRTGLSRGGLYAFMNGSTKAPRDNTLAQIAVALGTDLDGLRAAEHPPHSELDDPATVLLRISGDDLDIFQAIAIVRRLDVATMLEAELAALAEDLVKDPRTAAILETVRAARQAS